MVVYVGNIPPNHSVGPDSCPSPVGYQNRRSGYTGSISVFARRRSLAPWHFDGFLHLFNFHLLKTWFLLGNMLHLYFLWFSGKSHLTAKI